MAVGSEDPKPWITLHWRSSIRNSAPGTMTILSFWHNKAVLVGDAPANEFGSRV